MTLSIAARRQLTFTSCLIFGFAIPGRWTDPRLSEPTIEVGPAHKQYVSLIADDSTGPPLRNLQFQYSLGRRYLYGDSEGQPLFTNNETICSRIHTCDERCPSQYVKDAFHRYIIHDEACVNPEQTGTKACIHYSYEVPASGSARASHPSGSG